MKKIVFALAVLCSVTACQKVIHPSLVTGASQLVLQGAISDTAGPYHVLITQSVGFYSENVYPSVSGALVVVTDSTAGVRDTLSETSPGVYTTHDIVGRPGSTYTMRALVKGMLYTAVSTMPAPVPLDSVSFDNKSHKNTIRAVANFQDPPGIRNFYKIATFVNGRDLQELHPFDDRLSDGRYIREAMDNDTNDIKVGDNVRLFLVCVDSSVYTFLDEAQTIAYSNDNVVAPATPVSNINGGCLGYFSAQTVSTKSAPVHF